MQSFTKTINNYFKKRMIINIIKKINKSVIDQHDRYRITRKKINMVKNELVNSCQQ